MRVISPRLLSGLLCSALLPALTGCSLSHFQDPSTAASVLPAISGTVHGGQQPVSGSSVKLYASNGTALQGISTSLLTSAVTTDATGSFSITGLYPCPTPTTLVYLVVTGGNPGLGGSVNNTSLSMMALLGTCGTLTASTHVVVNELTTVAAVESLMPFMSDGTHIGADLTANPNGLATAFATASSIVDPSTGGFAALLPGQPTPPYALYNTLADILAACINSDGTTKTGGFYDTLKPCGSLVFTAGAGGGLSVANDTLVAMLRIAQFPSASIPQLFQWVGANPPFVPALAKAPTNDFTYGYTVSVPPTSGISSSNFWARMVAIDALQHIWVANYSTDTIHVYDQNLNLLSTIHSDTYSIFFMKADPSGNIWVYGSSILSKYAPDFTVLTPAGGINTSLLGFTGSNAGMDVDKFGNVWISSFKQYGVSGPSGSMVPCFAKFSPTGVPLFTAPGICFAAASVGPPLAVATDSAGNAYMGTNYPATILKVDASGNSLYGPTGKVSYRGVTLQYDPSLDQMWVTDDMYSIKIKGSDGSIQSYVRSSLGSTNTQYVTLDGANNFWITGTTDLNSSGIQCSAVNEYSPSGAISLAGHSSSDSCSLGGFKTPGLNYTQGIAIDAYGNIWVVNYGNHTLEKIPSQAAPKPKQTF